MKKVIFLLKISVLQVKIFNLEVEDFHTYYVGAKGVWVHNTNCGDIGVAQIEAQFGAEIGVRSFIITFS